MRTPRQFTLSISAAEVAAFDATAIADSAAMQRGRVRQGFGRIWDHCSRPEQLQSGIAAERPNALFKGDGGRWPIRDRTRLWAGLDTGFLAHDGT